MEPIEVGIAIMHDSAEIEDRLQGILACCSSRALNSLIDIVPAAVVPKGGSKTQMRLSIRYAKRYVTKPVVKSWGTANVPDRNKPTTGFTDTLACIMTGIPLGDLLNKLFEYNELSHGRLTVKDTKVVGPR